MTELLYNYDSYITEFDAEVLDCVPIEINKLFAYDIVLSKTCFFPEQGGQDCDTGIICGSMLSSKVLHVSLKDGTVHHICDVSLPIGDIVHGRIDSAARYDRMQQHSGEHLVSGTIHKLFGFDNVGFHLSDREVTLDFNGTFTPEDIILIENTVNKAVQENIETRIFFPSKEELATIDYRSKKEIIGDIRLVEFPGYDICACCAPHVRFTGEIGIIKIVSAEHFRSGTRMWIKCGMRALEDYRRLLDDAKSISRLTSSKLEDITSAVSKQCETVKTLRYNNILLEKRALSTVVDEVSSMLNPLIFLETGDPDNIREALNTLILRSNGYCAAFTGSDDRGYRFVIGARTLDCRDIISRMKNYFPVKGGGSCDMVQGSVTASRESILSFWNSI